MKSIKILIQTDEDCSVCDGGGEVTEISYTEHGDQVVCDVECEKCQGTGKKLEWIEAALMGNSLYMDGFF